MTKNKKHKNKTKKKIKQIIDVPVSDKESLGSLASSGGIDYNYQKYYNTFAFLKIIVKKEKHLKKMVCIPDVGYGWMKAFLSINLKEKKKNKIYTLKPVDSNNPINKFIKKIKQCLKHRFVPINLQLIVEQNNTHANMMLMDTKKKTIELFEPHGNRDKSSELMSVTKAYYKSRNSVKRFFKQYFPTYKFISPISYESSKGLQEKIDAFSGMCVSWSILYLHYRLLNPNVSQLKLVNYLNKTINKNILLRYTHYIEDTLKHKI